MEIQDLYQLSTTLSWCGTEGTLHHHLSFTLELDAGFCGGNFDPYSQKTPAGFFNTETSVFTSFLLQLPITYCGATLSVFSQWRTTGMLELKLCEIQEQHLPHQTLQSADPHWRNKCFHLLVGNMNFKRLFFSTKWTSEQAASQVKQPLSSSMYRPLLNTFLTVEPVSCLHPSRQTSPNYQHHPAKLSSVSIKKSKITTCSETIHSFTHCGLCGTQTGFKSSVSHTNRQPHVQTAFAGKVVLPGGQLHSGDVCLAVRILTKFSKERWNVGENGIFHS